ncbi:PREDICTED: uncharacterized protein LOC105153083 [Acromyrmex echinatior]|uniref:uncharacterized protein LOC105153083 n=1 Tax=Acromyrmex echinatior TaxID=103372 RepID=UPI000580F83B|nr:PREDICTED: uncharacterized protein LOC105153083 [Acromyrmex echinatior]
MEHPEERYYKLNRFVLLLTGLWPYQSKWSTCLVRAVITTILLSSVIFQLMSLFKSNITANFVIDMIPAFMPVMGSLSQMYARVGYVDKLRDLFEHMWNDWRLQKTNYETKIMQKHAETSKLLTLYYLRKKNIKLRFIQRKRRAFLSHKDVLWTSCQLNGTFIKHPVVIQIHPENVLWSMK